MPIVDYDIKSDQKYILKHIFHVTDTLNHILSTRKALGGERETANEDIERYQNLK